MVSPDRLGQQISALGRRLRGIADRALVRIITDSLNRQNLQIQTLADATNDDVERFQNYGLTSVPPEGSEAIVLAVGGQRENLIAVAVEDKRCRPRNLQSLEVRLYHADGQSYISLQKDGVVEVVGKKATFTISDEIVVNTAKFTLSAQEMTFNGPALFPDGVKIGEIEFLGHWHIDSRGGQTSEPKG